MVVVMLFQGSNDFNASLSHNSYFPTKPQVLLNGHEDGL